MYTLLWGDEEERGRDLWHRSTYQTVEDAWQGAKDKLNGGLIAHAIQRPLGTTIYNEDYIQDHFIELVLGRKA